jgi:hypothetical protein
MEKKAKGISRSAILISILFGLIFIIALSSIYILYFQTDSLDNDLEIESNINDEINRTGLSFTLSFDPEFIDNNVGPYINGTLSIINYGPNTINFSNDYELGNGTYVNITNPNNISYIEKLWFWEIGRPSKPIILENGEEIVLSFNLIELDYRYRAPRLFNEEGEYSIYIFYDNTESNKSTFTLKY